MALYSLDDLFRLNLNVFNALFDEHPTLEAKDNAIKFENVATLEIPLSEVDMEDEDTKEWCDNLYNNKQ